MNVRLPACHLRMHLRSTTRHAPAYPASPTFRGDMQVRAEIEE